VALKVYQDEATGILYLREYRADKALSIRDVLAPGFVSFQGDCNVYHTKLLVSQLPNIESHL
jgi:hypothetical protein